MMRQSMSLGLVGGALMLALAGGATALALQPSGATTAAQPASAPGKPKIHPREATVEQVLRIGVPIAPVIAPDGTAFMRERHKGTFQLYRRAAGAGPDGKLERMTNFTDGVGGASLSPDGKTLLVVAARGGSEQTRVYRMDPKATEMIDDTTAPILAPGAGTPAAKGGIQFAPTAWLRDSSGFFYRANDQKPTDFYIYRYDLATGQSAEVLKREGSWSASSPTRDGSRVIVSRGISASQSEVYELDIASGKLTDLSLRDGEGQPVSNSVVGYLPGEKEVLLLSDFQTGTDGLWIHDLSTGKARSASDVLKRLGIDAPELDGVSMSFEGDLLAIQPNVGGYSRLYVVSLPDFTPVQTPEIPRGLIGINQFRDRRLVYSVNSAKVPGVSYSTTIDAAGKASAPEPLTVADDMGVDLGAFIEPTLVEYTTFDGITIPALLYLPEGRKAGDGRGAVPFIIDYHGGPEGQSRPVFAREYQLFLSRGYGIMAPNVRGSTGYGRAFQMMDNYKKRWDSVKDGVAAAAWLVEKGLAKPGHIASRGGSYGGFMSVAVLIEDSAQAKASGKPRLFGAGQKSVGIVNFRTFLEQTADYRRKLREVEYGPLEDTEFLDSISPIKRLDEVQVPMMLVHGLNDPRVPIGEAMQLAIALQKRGFDPEILYYPDEGHGLAKTPNRVLMMERSLRFFDRTIKPGAN